MVWLIDLKEEGLFLDDAIQAYSENFLYLTFTKKVLLLLIVVLIMRLAGQARLKQLSPWMIR